MNNKTMRKRSRRMRELKAERIDLEGWNLDANLREYAGLYNANQSDAYRKLEGQQGHPAPVLLNLVTDEHGWVVSLEIV